MEIADGIWTVDHFLTADECRQWIDFAEGIGFDEAPITVGFGKEALNKEMRNNSRVMIDDEDRAFGLWQRAREHLPPLIYHRVARGLNERLRFYRYDPGQQFKYHFDGSFRRPTGEQSLLTFMVYLNEDFAGGKTTFLNLEETIVTPRTGLMIAFRHNLVHQGAEVLSGRKYVLRSDVMFSS
ncbi:MAG: 2OG-Fe(II) oxygenase [Acidobacteria bacterium]|nr:2OG-Fe(II) oxygenase [Acidobacteriota bacterium]